MNLFSSSLAADIVRSHGIVSVSRLLADGASTHVIRRHVTEGLLVRVHDGVYRLATSPDTFEARCVAACLADPEIVITGVAAGRLWGFRHISRVTEPIALVAHARTPITSGIVLRRTNQLDESDAVRRDDGIRIASPPRAWFDCARDVDDERFESLTEWVLDHHTSMPTLWRLTTRLTARGRPGLARVHRVISQRPTWQKPADSRLEMRVLNGLERRGVGPLVRQHPIVLPDGTRIHADGADPSIRWALEVDHVTWHGGRYDAQRDKARDRGARRVGWQVDRVTDLELAHDFDAAIDDLVDLHALRRAEFNSNRKSNA